MSIAKGHVAPAKNNICTLPINNITRNNFNRMKKTLLIALTFLLTPACLIAQDPHRFDADIAKFSKLSVPSNGELAVFTGSSSIRLWHSIEQDMKGFEILNRGFGGSTLLELNHYWSRITGNHQPDIVVVYCGENDIAQGRSVGETVEAFEAFIALYKKTYPEVPLVYVAMKPSLDRWHLWEQYQQADKQIRKIIGATEKATFIDLSQSMFRKGTLKEDIFIEDGLHMNVKGYKGWRKQLRPLLKRQMKSLNQI